MSYVKYCEHGVPFTKCVNGCAPMTIPSTDTRCDNCAQTHRVYEGRVLVPCICPCHDTEPKEWEAAFDTKFVKEKTLGGLGWSEVAQPTVATMCVKDFITETIAKEVEKERAQTISEAIEVLDRYFTRISDTRTFTLIEDAQKEILSLGVRPHKLK